VVGVVAGTVALQHDPADVQVGPAAAQAGVTLPVIELDLDGWVLDSAGTYDDVGDLTRAGDIWAFSEQVFRPADRLDGPAIYLAHRPASDAVGHDPNAELVDVDGTDGYLAQRGVVTSLVWSPASGDSQAELSATGIDPEEVVALAASLELRNDELAYPAGSDTGLGFSLPDGPLRLVEIELAGDTGRVDVHRSWYEGGGATGPGLVEVQVDNRGERAFETGLYAPAGDTWDVFEQVTVLDRPALLRHDATSGDWIVQWRHTERAWVTVTISAGTKEGTIDRASVDAIIDHLRQGPAGSWTDIVAAGDR
jgi:hypothetical protein